MYRIPNQALLLALRTLSVSFSDSEALLRFTDSLVVHWAFLFDAKACPHPQTALFTWTSVLHRGHTFLRRKLNSIAFAINRAKYQTLQSRKTQKKTSYSSDARHVFLRVTNVDYAHASV